MAEPLQDRPSVTYQELVAENWRVQRLRMWSEMLWQHVRDGCALDVPADQPRPMVCVIHGYYKGDRVITKEEWMRDL